jgi:hypothetical protein
MTSCDLEPIVTTPNRDLSDKPPGASVIRWVVCIFHIRFFMLKSFCLKRYSVNALIVKNPQSSNLLNVIWELSAIAKLLDRIRIRNRDPNPANTVPPSADPNLDYRSYLDSESLTLLHTGCGSAPFGSGSALPILFLISFQRYFISIPHR